MLDIHSILLKRHSDLAVGFTYLKMTFIHECSYSSFEKSIENNISLKQFSETLFSQHTLLNTFSLVFEKAYYCVLDEKEN